MSNGFFQWLSTIPWYAWTTIVGMICATIVAVARRGNGSERH